MSTLGRIVNFIRHDIWRIRLTDLPKKKSFFLRELRIFVLSIRGFDEDKCLLRASALTFYSLVSIVPVAAMLFGIAKGFGFEKRLEKQLMEQFHGHEEIITQVITFAESMLANTKGGLIAGIGVILLFYAAIKVLNHIETSFNDIWGIQEPRKLGRKFSDYLSVMVLGPILIILSSSVTVFITTQVTSIMEKIALLGMFSGVISILLSLLPYCIIWVLFSFLYIFMPNTKVNFASGLLAGIIAGTIYQIVQLGYIMFQVETARYNAIYGSFAALPLFLIWLQLSWLIVLFGAEYSFARQNVDTYEFEPDSLKTSPSFKRLLTLQTAHLIVKFFADGKQPLTATEISHRLEIPIRLVHLIVFDLTAAGIIVPTETIEYREPAYLPARDINALTIHFVIDELEHCGTDTIPAARTKETETISEILDTFREEISRSPANRLLRDI
ncbi:MAG TPA: YihY/virulence factor BrkB family protein [Deltaproteobacteria bacterium]|nr:YihY/virulence factor BrkB family protein [Deltaproteobacteria bacterium]